MRRRIRGDNRNACVYQVLDIRSLSGIVIGLNNNKIILFCDAVLQQSVFRIIIGFTADTGKFDIRIVFRRLLHLIGKPCGKCIRARTCHKAYLLLILISCSRYCHAQYHRCCQSGRHNDGCQSLLHNLNPPVNLIFFHAVSFYCI